VASPWPVVQYTARSWPPPGSAADPLWSRRRRRANTGTYQQAIVPKISTAEVALPSSTISAVQSITDDLTRFDAQYPGGAPFSAVLLRSESSASSQIEHLTANARRISLARLGDHSRVNASLIAKNTAALEAALELADQLNVNTILAMHHALLEEAEPETAGTIRSQGVWIGGDSPVTAMFVPPEHFGLHTALEDLIGFMQRQDIPAIAHAAIAHAQFETIHPFTDGNGRTGRALVSALLRARGTTRNFTVPLSSGLLTNTKEYFEALNDYRRGNIQPIIEQFVAAANRAMPNVQVLLHDIDALRNDIFGTAQRITKNLRVVAELCTTEPAFTARTVENLGVPSSTAYTIINKLVEHDILRPEQKIQGQSVWSVRALTNALDAFAERAGRRT